MSARLDREEATGSVWTWRLIVDGAAAGAWNMGVDETLVESVRAGAPPTLRLYRWSPACLSFGRNQRASEAYDRDRLAGIGVDVVRRPTGGRGVLHADELTYSVVVPDRALGGPRSAYVTINGALVEALRRLGVAAASAAASDSPVPRLSNGPCFAEPAPGEVLAAGRKLVGSAQQRSGGVLLQHGSLPLRRTALEDAVFGSEGTGPAFLESLLASVPAWEELVAALEAVWGERIGPVRRAPLEASERARADELAARYADGSWTWRL